MSWARVQNVSATGTGGVSSISVTLPNPVTAGNLIVVTIGNDATTPTVSDSINSTNYTLGNFYNDAGKSVYTYYYKVITGGSSFQITATFSGTDYPAIYAAEYSFSGTLSVDTAPTGTSGSNANPVLAGALTITGNDLVICTCTLEAGGLTATASSGYTIQFQTPLTGGQHYGIAMSDQLNVTANTTPGFTLSGSASWGICATAFKTPLVTFSGEPAAILPAG
jgi:hypothetical protein